MRIFIVLVVLGLTVNCFALTVDEESYIAKTLALEKLKEQRNTLIAKRDDLISQEEAKTTQAKDALITIYEPQIDTIETQISQKESEINAIIKK